MATKTKKVVEKTPTITQLELKECYNALLAYISSKKKSNYELEKNRLDKVIDSLLNHSKTK